MIADGRIKPQERVVIFNTCSALKYQDSAALDLPHLPANDAIDYTQL